MKPWTRRIAIAATSITLAASGGMLAATSASAVSIPDPGNGSRYFTVNKTPQSLSANFSDPDKYQCNYITVCGEKNYSDPDDPVDVCDWDCSYQEW